MKAISTVVGALLLCTAISHGAEPPEAAPADLKLSELFEPIGSRGLELTEKVRSLAGKTVRIAGYMVRRDRGPAGSFLLAPLPVQLHEDDFGPADDVPASTIHVFRADGSRERVPYRPGLLTVVGTLEIGNREEPDGRISTVRLYLRSPQTDAPTMSESHVPAAPRREP